MERLQYLDALAVRQKKEWGEILTGLETCNRYAVIDAQGQEIYHVAEEPGMMLSRLFLKAWRPFKMSISSIEGQAVLNIDRPFRWYFHEVAVFTTAGEKLGTIRREFAWLQRIYRVLDHDDNQVFRIVGPFIHPWTFNVFQNGQQVGKISKRWSGLGKEMFTDADNFGLTFPAGTDVKSKALLLSALFLIDFVHFETSK